MDGVFKQTMEYSFDVISITASSGKIIFLKFLLIPSFLLYAKNIQAVMLIIEICQ